MNVSIIAEKIKARRSLLGIDQKSAAELSGISVHTLSDIESAKGNPSLKMLCKVLDAVGLEMRLELKRLGDEPYRNATGAAKQAGEPYRNAAGAAKQAGEPYRNATDVAKQAGIQ